MAPLPVLGDTLGTAPHVAGRQNTASPHEITMTIAHPSTTYTSIINLGSPTATTPTAVPIPLPTSTLLGTTPTQVVVSRSDTSDSGIVAGATIGGVLGFFVLIAVFYKCCINNRSALWVPSLYTSYDDSDSENGSSRASRTSRVRRRGGDASWSRRNRRGDRVRKPQRAMVSYHRRHRDSSTSSDGSWSTNRRREGRVSGPTLANKNGLMGWYWASSGRSKGRGYSSENRRDVWGGGRGKSIDD
jgi:hypothetical protein